MRLIGMFIHYRLSVKKACDFLNEKMPDDGDIETTLSEFQSTGDQVYSDIQKMLSNRKNSASGNVSFDLGDGFGDQSKENQSSASNAKGSRATKATTSRSTASKPTASKPATSGRGRGASRGSTRATAATSARGSTVRVHQ